MSQKKKAGNDQRNAFEFEQRVVVLPRPKAKLRDVCLALTLQCKNLYNNVHFAVNNVLTAYGYDAQAKCWRLKATLHDHQRTAIARYNVAVDAVNAGRQKTYDEKVAAGGDDAKKAKLKLLPRLEATIAHPHAVVQDLTVLDNLMRAWPGASHGTVYGRLPAAAAQQVIKRYLDAWKGYKASLKTYQADHTAAVAMTGKPRPPGYLNKKGRFVFEFPLTQVGKTLVNLGKRQIPVDYEESLCLTAEEMAAWNEYGLRDAIKKAQANRAYEGGVPQHLRIVPAGGQVKMEVVVRLPGRVSETSLLARLRSALPAEATRPGQINDALIAAIENLDVSSAGADMGLNNTITIAYSTGRRADIVSGGRLDAVYGGFTRRLDQFASQHLSSEIRALQARKNELQAKDEKLSRDDDLRLRKALAELYVHPEYQRLADRRRRWLNDYLHKLSFGLVRSLADCGIQVLVVGKNKGWKDEISMGRKQNRRFGQVPLARLIDLIRYKAEAQGIVVVTTEESYTSKTSFVNNAPLQVKAAGSEGRRKKQAQEASEGVAVEPPAQAAPEEAEQIDLQGKRLKDKRHTFVNHNQTGRWARVHADVNAAMNVMRKIFKGFAYHHGLTLKYNLLRLSARLGLTPIRFRALA